MSLEIPVLDCFGNGFIALNNIQLIVYKISNVKFDNGDLLFFNGGNPTGC
ncbi:MAG: hypothetical protein DID89_2727547181 [Candidatus Nitrotoga sp. CP45]|nr:MAG: hypothetical protein DID89_2727547181 [Candidatus Nitrotoga sp. CP45]